MVQKPLSAKRPLSPETSDFLSCLDRMHSKLSLWKVCRQDFCQSAIIAAASIELQADQDTIVAELRAVAMFILEMYWSVRVRGKDAIDHGNREARMIAIDALVSLNNFAAAKYRASVVKANRLTVMLVQDKTDRGGSPTRGSFELIRAIVAMPAARARQACVARA